MKQYIGTKMVMAAPAVRLDDGQGNVRIELLEHNPIPCAGDAVDMGYKVVYPDGYESFCPQDAFEKYYREMKMKQYVVTNILRAHPCCKIFLPGKLGYRFSDMFEVIPADAETEAGYMVYDDGNYKRWVAKDAFEEAYREADGMPFGLAIEAAKKGKRIARKGWNGKNQYVELAYCISYKNNAAEIVNVNHCNIGNKALAFVGTSGVQLGWLASQGDMLADDWYIV